MRINTNLTAMNTYTQYTKNNNKIASSVEKLSSGYAINSAADNAAGLAISEKMRAQIRGLEKASTNSQDAISLVQTAEGSLSESTEILQRMRELAVQSASDTNEDQIDRTALQDEFEQLQSELDDIAQNSTFNKKNLLDGSLSETTKNLTNTDLQNSGMTVELGKSSTGTYNFSVTTKLESAAVDGKQPTSYELVTDGAASYFDNTAVPNAVTLGSNVAESDLLNGNYTLSADYGDDGCITVTAKGDNNQTFTATISQSSLESLATAAGADLKLDMTFNADADDAFKITVGMSGNIASTESNYDTLAENLSKLTVSVSGGVTAQEAEYGVYANLTGAESIKLDAGMDSVSFSNGVKVSFDELTASSVDTENKAALSANIVGAGITNATTSWSNLSAMDDSTIANGSVTLTSSVAAGTVTFTATDATGATFTATATDTDLVGTDTTTATTLTFKDASGNDSFTMDYTTVAVGAGAFTADAVGVTGTVENAGHNYAKTFSASTTDLSASTASSFSVEETANKGLTFQVGANEGDDMTIYIDKMDANYLGVASASVATQSAASSSISNVDAAINQVSSQRAYLGAIQNRLDHKIANLDTSTENLTSAESQIRDVDMAKEMTNFTNANILQQAATAMLAQANSLPQNVLSLLG
jgi:flagellin